MKINNRIIVLGLFLGFSGFISASGAEHQYDYTKEVREAAIVNYLRDRVIDGVVRLSADQFAVKAAYVKKYFPDVEVVEDGSSAAGADFPDYNAPDVDQNDNQPSSGYNYGI